MVTMVQCKNDHDWKGKYKRVYMVYVEWDNFGDTCTFNDMELMEGWKKEKKRATWKKYGTT